MPRLCLTWAWHDTPGHAVHTSWSFDDAAALLTALTAGLTWWGMTLRLTVDSPEEVPTTSEVVPAVYRYHRGQGVRYAGDPTRRYTVTQQRYTVRDVLAPLVEYLIRPPTPSGAFWVSDIDLEEDAP